MAGKITVVTGGARSGKSNFAEELAKTSVAPVAYLATAIAFDEGMKDRIQKHQASRPKEWTTYEGYKRLYTVIEEIAREHGTILLDCITIMVTNLMFDNECTNWDEMSRSEIDKMEEEIKQEIHKLMEYGRKHNMWLIMVTNEIGMGIVPENRISRIFRDIAGRINQIIAKEADEVYLTVSGLPLKLK